MELNSFPGNTNLLLVEQQTTDAMNEALASLDQDLKGPYFEAWDLEPELVERETPKIYFLRTEDFHVVKAATRLAWYWKYRKECFGSRWLLNMDQTGRGALTQEDVEILRSGYFIGFYDPAKGTIIVQDSSRIGLRAWDENVVRCNFYWNFLFGKEAAQTIGLRFINVISSAPKRMVDVQHRGWDIILRAFPVKVKQVMVLKSYEEAKQVLVDFMAFGTTQIIQHHMSGERKVELLDSGSAESNLRLLEARGIPRNFIPPCCGGSYNYSEFDNWVRTRISIESIMAAAPPILNASLWRPPPPPATTSRTTAPTAFTMSAAALVLPPPRKRPVVEESQRSLVYSRRYNHKKRQKELSLKDSHRLLSIENETLRQEQARLEQLLAQTRTLLASYGIQENTDQKNPPGLLVSFPSNHKRWFSPCC